MVDIFFGYEFRQLGFHDDKIVAELCFVCNSISTVIEPFFKDNSM